MKTIDDIILKPAHWRWDDYQQAKAELKKLILEMMPKEKEVLDESTLCMNCYKELTQ